jgi:exodeoxyribonuclease V alpha subunit
LNEQETSQATEGSFTGRLIKTRMRDYQSGFAIFDLRDKTTTVTCKGYMFPAPNGTLLKADGVWIEDAKWGKQLSDCTVAEIRTDLESIHEYLCGVNGIGAKLADEIVEEFGENLYEDIQKPDAMKRLSAIRYVTHEKARDIIARIQDTQQQRQLWEMLAKHGVTSFSAVLKIFRKYGSQSLEVFLNDPYGVGMRAGLTFRACDAIAISRGLPSSSITRLQAAIWAVLTNAAQNGHSYVNYSELLKYAKQKMKPQEYLYRNGSSAPAVNTSFAVAGASEVTKENKSVYLTRIRKAEIETAEMVKILVRTGKAIECNPDELCAYAESVLGVTYADKQREAFALLQQGGLSIITGGPGTGKTTVVKGLLAACEKIYPHGKIKLCAPTGRASQRMKEVTGKEATTIHRLLEYKPYNGKFSHKDKDDPIDADFLIIDEGSMLSVELASLLFSAIKPGTMVVICGDVDQLPAVGAGNVLHDMIFSEKIPVVALTKTHRQAENSLIIKNAGRIRDGISKMFEGEDFEVIETDDTKAASIVKEQFIAHYNKENIFSCQILVPARKRTQGSKTNSGALNDIIQTTINPVGPQIKFGETTFRVGDKIMMMRNNYDEGYYNGDVGYITNITDSITVKIEDNEILIDQSLFDDISLAYATTIHKSQGSEYDTVIILLPSQPKNMLQRNLLYTAVTRAKKKVILVAAENSINVAINKKDAIKRNSHLTERIRA